MKTHEFIKRHLDPTGAVLEKRDSDHHIYRLPSGRTFLLPVGGKHSECKPYLVSKLKRLMREVATP